VSFFSSRLFDPLLFCDSRRSEGSLVVAGTFGIYRFFFSLFRGCSHLLEPRRLAGGQILFFFPRDNPPPPPMKVLIGFPPISFSVKSSFVDVFDEVRRVC